MAQGGETGRWNRAVGQGGGTGRWNRAVEQGGGGGGGAGFGLASGCASDLCWLSSGPLRFEILQKGYYVALARKSTKTRMNCTKRPFSRNGAFLYNSFEFLYFFTPARRSSLLLATGSASSRLGSVRECAAPEERQSRPPLAPGGVRGAPPAGEASDRGFLRGSRPLFGRLWGPPFAGGPGKR